MRKNLSGGFTLIETLIVIALTGVVMLALSFLIQYFYKTNAYVLEQSQAVRSARTSVTHAMTDLREASYGADGSYPIAYAGTSTVTFFANLGGAYGTGVEKVRYYLSDATLYRGVTLPASSPPSYALQPETQTLVVQNIRNDSSSPLFSYFDADGNLLATPAPVSKVASIHIRVLTDVNPERAPNVYTLDGSATLRNLLAIPTL